MITPESREQAMRVLKDWLEENLGSEMILHDPHFSPSDLEWLQLFRTANPSCVMTIMTSRGKQPPNVGAEGLEGIYADAWRSVYDQRPPKAEIIVISGEQTKASPIHDRWLVSGQSGLRFGSSLNHLGETKDSEISEMSIEDASQKRAEIESFINREKSEHHGERLRLMRFWL